MDLAQVDTPACGSTFARISGEQPNIDAAIAKGGKWTDTAYGRSVAMDGMDDSSWLWKRAQDVFPESAGYSLWGEGGLDWHSLNQGYLGNCWFLVSLENLALKDPKRLEDLFVYQQLNDSRIYGVDFWTLGVPVTVVVDDYIPNYSWGGAAFGNVSDNKGLWPILLEKAFGK